MTRYSLDLAPPEDIPVVTVVDSVTYDWTPTISPSEGFYREKRLNTPEQGPSIDNQGSNEDLDVDGSSWFYYGPIPSAQGFTATPSEFVWPPYKPGATDTYQSVHWMMNLRFITDSPEVELRLRAANTDPKLGLVYVNGHPIDVRSPTLTQGSGGYRLVLTFPDSRERLLDFTGLNGIHGLFGGVAVNTGYSLSKPDLTEVSKRRVALIGDSSVDGQEGVSDVETSTWRWAIKLGATDIMSAGLGGSGWVYEANADPMTKFQERLSFVVDQEPDIVLFSGGLTDSTANGVTQQELVDQIKADIAALGSGPSVYLTNTASGGSGSMQHAAMVQVSNETGVPFLDVDFHADDIPMISPGNPTYEGHQMIGDRLFEAMPASIPRPISLSCFTMLRGKRIRVTRLDECGNVPSSGTECSQVVTDGFMTISLSPEVESGVEIIARKADGSLCVNDRGPDSLKRITVGIMFCGVDPDLLDLVTNAGPYQGYNGDTAGLTVPEGTVSDRFALELWTGLTGQACPSGVEEASGYLLLPFVSSGVLGDLEINGENAIDFSMTGGFTVGGNNWGVGPYEVVINGIAPDLLPTPLGPSDHMLVTATGVAPPPSACGCSPMP